MKIRWGRHPWADTATLHAIDIDKQDGNPYALCGGILLNTKTTELDAAFGESRVGKCQKCFKISRERMQKAKKQGV